MKDKLNWILGKEEKPKGVDIYVKKAGSPRFKKAKNVPLGKDTVKVDGHTCDINKADLCHNGGDLRLYYQTNKNDNRSGNLEPISWGRFTNDISGADIYDIEHDVSAFEGVMNMLGIGGTSTLKKQHWLVIIMVAVMGILAFFFLKPYLPMM